MARASEVVRVWLLRPLRLLSALRNRKSRGKGKRDQRRPSTVSNESHTQATIREKEMRERVAYVTNRGTDPLPPRSCDVFIFYPLQIGEPLITHVTCTACIATPIRVQTKRRAIQTNCLIEYIYKKKFLS